MSSQHRHVVLVKEKNEGEAGDPYEQIFIEKGFGVSFVSTVEFIYHELDILSDKLNQKSTLNGVVCTSPRGVKALIEAFSRLNESERATWQDRPLFVVGPGSAAVWLSSPYSTYLKVIAHGGNGTELARHIAEMYAAHELNPTRSLPLLVLCGNLRRPELTKSLTESSIPYSELQVYDTVQRENVVPAFDEVLDSIDHNNMTEIWLCFFSPSGAISLNQSINRSISEYWPNKLPMHRLRIAAIGNTSADAMKALNWQVDAIAAHPNPASLFDAIESR